MAQFFWCVLIKRLNCWHEQFIPDYGMAKSSISHYSPSANIVIMYRSMITTRRTSVARCGFTEDNPITISSSESNSTTEQDSQSQSCDTEQRAGGSQQSTKGISRRSSIAGKNQHKHTIRGCYRFRPLKKGYKRLPTLSSSDSSSGNEKKSTPPPVAPSLEQNTPSTSTESISTTAPEAQTGAESIITRCQSKHIGTAQTIDLLLTQLSSWFRSQGFQHIPCAFYLGKQLRPPVSDDCFCVIVIPPVHLRPIVMTTFAASYNRSSLHKPQKEKEETHDDAISTVCKHFVQSQTVGDHGASSLEDCHDLPAVAVLPSTVMKEDTDLTEDSAYEPR